MSVYPRDSELVPEYRRFCSDNLDAFLELARDEHIRRYLLDGSIVDREWAQSELERSDGLFDQCDVGLWLVHLHEKPVGFIGYRVFEDIEPEPQLLYAFLEEVCGRGHATRAAQWLLSRAWDLDWSRVVAAVDEVNGASVRVLEKVGFGYRRSIPGAFGPTRLYAIDAPR